MRLAFFTSLKSRLLAIPGVESVGSITDLPVAGTRQRHHFPCGGGRPANDEPQTFSVASPDHTQILQRDGTPNRLGSNFHVVRRP
jgi:hypothetical protein